MLGTITIHPKICVDDILTSSFMKEWKNVVFHAFELPSLLEVSFEQRMKKLESFEINDKSLKVVKMTQIKGK
jgi:hypothetical protein